MLKKEQLSLRKIFMHYIFFSPLVLDKNLYIHFTTKAHSFVVMKGTSLNSRSTLEYSVDSWLLVQNVQPYQCSHKQREHEIIRESEKPL